MNTRFRFTDLWRFNSQLHFIRHSPATPNNLSVLPPLNRHAHPPQRRPHQIVDIGIVAIVNTHTFCKSQGKVDVGVAAVQTTRCVVQWGEANVGTTDTRSGKHSMWAFK